jgi:hypothetical protein
MTKFIINGEISLINKSFDGFIQKLTELLEAYNCGKEDYLTIEPKYKVKKMENDNGEAKNDES